MPTPAATTVEFTPSEMRDTLSPRLDYTYEDVSDPLRGLNRRTLRAQHLERLGLPALMAAPLHIPGISMKTELLGANAAPLALEGGVAATSVDLDLPTAKKLATSFALLPHTQEPDRVFLNLENVRGKNDAAVFYVYVGLPAGERPEAHPENKVGVLSLFGVSHASDPAHGANGITQVFEITDLIDRLHLANPQGLRKLDVQFVSRTRVVPEHQISVDRVSVFRKGR
jgi:tyrosinase